MTENQDATYKCHLTASYRAKITEIIKQMCGLSGPSVANHKEEREIRLKQAKQDVEKVNNHILSLKIIDSKLKI